MTSTTRASRRRAYQIDSPMPKPPAHRWTFRARFRRHAFGWKSQPAIKRVKEAVSELKQVARKDRLLAAEGAVAFLERLSPAIEHVDGSSGAIGTAANNAVEALVPIIAEAPAGASLRAAWLERLFDAYQEDGIPYIELLGDHWGDLCASQAVAGEWADGLIEPCRLAWSPDPNLRGFFKGATICLSALLKAERHQEILELLELEPRTIWHYRQYGVKALAAMGRKAEAIRYAEAGGGLNDNPVAIARVCETVLLSSGMTEEAYQRYGLLANQAGTNLAWFRAVCKKYPHRPADVVLRDLARITPGDEGKWFAAAKSVGLFDEAIALANTSPCSPQTLTRAARDFSQKNPDFAVEAGLAALRWLVEGYGYDITATDVLDAYKHTTDAAGHAGRSNEIHERVRTLVLSDASNDRFVTKVLGHVVKPD